MSAIKAWIVNVKGLLMGTGPFEEEYLVMASSSTSASRKAIQDVQEMHCGKRDIRLGDALVVDIRRTHKGVKNSWENKILF